MLSTLKRKRNEFLAVLEAELPDVTSRLEDIVFRPGQSLQRAGEPIVYVYLPHDGVVSLLAPGTAGLEFAMVGHEGLVGGASAFGLSDAHCNAMVRVAGSGSRLRAEHLQAAVAANERVRGALARCNEAVTLQAQQTAACNALHSVEARLCRWLLELHDRVETSELPVTQASLADSLGVQRTTVTLALGKLQETGALVCRRGRIQLLDTPQIVQSACACYDGLGHRSVHFAAQVRPGIGTPALAAI
jgi:CRP-like cAMP-binding protein